jgi:hypothetical protein
MVLSASLPTLGAGTLKDRDDPKLFGTSKVRDGNQFVRMSNTVTGIQSPSARRSILQNVCYRLFKESSFGRYVPVLQRLSGRRYSQ